MATPDYTLPVCSSSPGINVALHAGRICIKNRVEVARNQVSDRINFNRLIFNISTNILRWLNYKPDIHACILHAILAGVRLDLTSERESVCLIYRIDEYIRRGISV